MNHEQPARTSQRGSIPQHPTILHLGLGSFHRAHQAVYLERLNAIEARDGAHWSIVGANLRPDLPETIAALRASNGAYTLETLSPAGEVEYQTIRSIREVIAWEPGIAPVIACGAAPDTRIISFTVTESGYYLDASHHLDRGNADIQADLARVRAGEAGTTIYGGLYAILDARMRAAAGPVTLLSCDNLRHNGERVASGLREFIAEAWREQPERGAALLDWVAAHIRCPGTMVDRITPRPPPELRERVRIATGIDDAAAITAESFIQWVIEDDFIAGRPAWERVGVELVEAVAPWEEAKVRILNASHSCIAWAGTLAGLSFIHEGMLDAQIRRFAYDYVTDDVIPCLSAGAANSGAAKGPADLPGYRDVVLARFANPAIRDTNQRVAMDGFSKIAGFIAPTLREAIAAGRSCDSAAMLPALFLAFLARWHRDALPYVYEDQAMDPVAAHAICAAPDPVIALCADRGLWGELAGDARLIAAVRGATTRVEQWMKNRR